jgi:putative DNA methylase
MTDTSRLIERAFPLKQASIDSVHEKNVRHGHISTLHLWPARRPLAACRAALLATLLPDPGTPESRKDLCERIGGKLAEYVEKKKMPNGKIVERVKEETVGGVLRWIGTQPKSGGKKKKEEYRLTVEQRDSELAWFRKQIRAAYGGKAPVVMDPFSGGGAIPLEAMRLGCETIAVDINPVAWFLLKCTLDFPQRLSGRLYKLPEMVFDDETFVNDFYKSHPHLMGSTKKTKKQKELERKTPGLFDKSDSNRIPKADLAWHLRFWGRWVYRHARADLAKLYPVYASFEPLDKVNAKPYEAQDPKLLDFLKDGTPDIDSLNADFSTEYLANKRNPRWVAKPPVAYLWARTVECKNCRCSIPILKTTWLCRSDTKRVRFKIIPRKDRKGVEFKIERNVPIQGGNSAQRREYDKRLGEGTMSKSGAKCPCCPATMTKEDMQIIGTRGEIGSVLTTVVLDGDGKEYRLPTQHELDCVAAAEAVAETAFASLPHGRPDDPITLDAKGNTWCALYGVDKFSKLFNPRQLATLATISQKVRDAHHEMRNAGVPADMAEAVTGLLALSAGRLADFSSTCVTWTPGGEFLGHTFVRWAIPFIWDYCEGTPLGTTSGNFLGAVEWIAKATEHTLDATRNSPPVTLVKGSATQKEVNQKVDLIMTDPPYYDAIGYSVLMDFFYVWHRRILTGLVEGGGYENEKIGPKWDRETNDGELVDDASRFGNDRVKSKESYEDGMYRAFQQCFDSLSEDGRLVLVFAHKHPDAWETLVSAVIRAGFVSDGSWPIQTERAARTRSQSAAALSSSVWLVCKKRSRMAKPGWDNKVLDDMRVNINERLREYWDAGIRGPDFVWAATGPALEAYSKHPIVKKANDPGKVMSVGEFLEQVRRMVVDFVVGQVLTGDKEQSDMAAADRMDAPTAYYLLHRNDFGLDDAPAGACILYATACGISDRDLEATWNLVSHKGGKNASEETDEVEVDSEDGDEESIASSGNQLQLKSWSQRKAKLMGYEAPGGATVPLIDRVHRLLHLWKAGDLHKVDEYLDDNGLRRHELFKRLVQSLIELARKAGIKDELQLLESLSNHIQAKGATADNRQNSLAFDDE